MSQMIEDLLAAGVGAEQIEQLVTQLGGLSMYMPRHYDPDRSAVCRELAEVAGEETARAMVQMYAGCRIIIPLGRSFMRDRLAARVRAMRQDGHSVPQIARALRMHVRQVQRLLHAERDQGAA